MKKAKSEPNSSLDCATKYPIVLIHGTGFRDRKLINYWGRIPKALENAGAKVFYSNHDAWGTFESNAEIIKSSILAVLDETKAEKINLIAHSKGGIEARYMISALEMEPYIASLTTISTPHYGSKTMDFCFKLPTFLFKVSATFVNLYFKLLGDKHPDFYKASTQLTTLYCNEFNQKIINSENIYYQSYATKMKNSFSDILLFLPHFIVKRIEGDNDGIVAVNSATWVNFKGVITGKRQRGVSHADIVDLRRKDYSGIDVREIYLNIVKELKSKGF